MTAGHFTRTYEVWRSAYVQDPRTGELSYQWTKVADVSGRCYVTTMRDTFASAMQVGVLTWTFACHVDADVRKADQVRFDGRALKVQAVSVTSRGDRLQCLCQEVQT